MRILKVFAILYLICMPVMAQSEYFTYIDDDEKTIITGITREGVLYFSEENAITIPQQVTRVWQLETIKKKSRILLLMEAIPILKTEHWMRIIRVGVCRVALLPLT